MVFPSLAFQFEPGLVSQVGAFSVIAFSYLLHRFKKIMVIVLITLSLFIFFQSKVFAYVAYAPYTYSNPGWQFNNMNYYGRPWGYNPSIYFYPQLQYHSLWGTQPFYYYPHTPSPYRPYDCPFCNQRYNQQNNQNFPMPYIHPGGGAS
ncbi:MAG: hypothetical protein ACOYL6_14510 [Bacteriovoracaceae bacterium]